MPKNKLEDFEKIFCIPGIYKKILDNSANPVAIVNGDGVIVYINKMVAPWAGYKKEDILGKKFYELPFFTKQTVRITKKNFAIRKKPDKNIPPYEISFVTKGGQKLYGSINATPIYDKNKKLCGEIIQIYNITKYKYQEMELNLAFRAMETSVNAIVFADRNAKIIYANSAALKLLDYKDSAKIIGKRPVDFLKNKQEGYFIAKKIRNAKNNKFWTGDIIIKRSDGTEFLAGATINIIKDDFNKPEFWVCCFLDITEKRKNEEMVKYYSTHDELTGLYNRFFFKEALKKIDKKQLPIRIVMGDVNGLKLINDAFGHEHGDKLLGSIADILKNNFRKEDTVARWGGDEFAIIMPQANEEIIDKICNKISEDCEEIFHKPIILSISLGRAIKKSQDENIDKIIKEAEDQMYANKTLEDKSIHSLIIKFLIKSLKEKDKQNSQHHKRMEKLVQKFGAYLHLREYEINQLKILATLHDIGKINVSDAILQKKQPLSQEDWEVLKQHPLIGYRIAKSIPELAQVAPLILSHHERWDGGGYPQKLSGHKIPLLSRIMSIVDAYDVMVFAKRLYKKNISLKKAIVELEQNAGTQFDPSLVDQFVKMMTCKKSGRKEFDKITQIS